MRRDYKMIDGIDLVVFTAS